MRFKGKAAIVTGAASGIGRATAVRLANEGAKVMIADMNEAGLAETAAMIGAAAVAAPLNVADYDACNAYVEKAVQALGRLDVLCNIAGVLRMAPIDKIDAKEWRRIMSVNIDGVFYLSRAAMPHLLKTKGNIVNLASAAGLVGIPYNAPYSASKHAVVGLTKSMALEFAKQGIRVNAVCPGGVKTPMIATPPMEGVDYDFVMLSSAHLNGGELFDPEDIADAVAFLASDEAKRVSGVAFPVDGAQTAY
jgi:meso-butanediol dehydrogenase / (S,S)-butanediol dehydrogenase / diacetyl reductase